jgi:uncharacterized protein
MTISTLQTSTTEALLERIAMALERLTPPLPSPLVGEAKAYHWDGTTVHLAREFRPLPLALLGGIDVQRDTLLENSWRLARGQAAHDILLWGAKGCGKSALVKAGVGAVQAEGGALALVEIAADHAATLPALFDQLSQWTCPSIVLIDDLAFDAGQAGVRSLRSVLEGGVSARPAHVRLYVTSNKRTIVARDMAEQAAAVNARDVLDDQLALADRFGLSLGFHACDQETYLAIVANYAAHLGLAFDPHDAVQWSTQRGSRSGRVAWHYAVELAGRAGKSL